MCTSIKLKSIDNTQMLARTMDFSFELDLEMIIIPRNYPLLFSKVEDSNEMIEFIKSVPPFNWVVLDKAGNCIIIEPLKINSLEYKPFGQGNGNFGIPGDYTPPSRFISVFFNKISGLKSKDEEELVVNANNVLNSVTVPRGSVVTQRDTLDYTQHTSFMISSNSNYYYTLYSNPEIQRVKLDDYILNLSKPVTVQLKHKPSFDILIE